MKRAMLALVAALCLACSDPIAAPITRQAATETFSEYWVDTVAFGSRAFLGLGGLPTAHCVEIKLADIHYSGLVPSYEEYLGGIGCPDSTYNRGFFGISLLRSTSSLLYYVDLGADTLIYSGSLTSANHIVGSVILTPLGATVGTWHSGRLVPADSTSLRATLDQTFKSFGSSNSITRDTVVVVNFHTITTLLRRLP